LRAEWSSKETHLARILNGQCPDYVFANAHDYAYGRFLLVKKNRAAAMAALKAGGQDVFERALLWGSLSDCVREAELNPRHYIELAQETLPEEKDESLAQSIIGRTIT